MEASYSRNPGWKQKIHFFFSSSVSKPMYGVLLLMSSGGVFCTDLRIQVLFSLQTESIQAKEEISVKATGEARLIQNESLHSGINAIKLGRERSIFSEENADDQTDSF